MRRLSSNRGDTLVEVLLAIAIVSLVLSASFASARQSLLNTQRSQERAEAARYVEQQLERLKVAADNPETDLFNAGVTGPYCIDTSLNHPNGECSTGIDGRYKLSITRSTVSPGQYRFLVRAHWTQIGGENEEEVNNYYKIYPR
jgi:prepilin-type N-terminal cleavage/methylation domain-containing protein